jgi:FkbM family methyltransferase
MKGLEITGIKGALRRAGVIDRKGLKGFLRDVAGVIHVGAHTGQERSLYQQYRLRVLWIEPLTSLYEVLVENLAEYPAQRAVQALITDKDGCEYPFHIASNAGGSSSILELKLHEDIWPDVTTTETIMLRSRTLESLIKEKGIDPDDYDALVMDTQGSELLVLNGAGALVSGFKYIQTEVADFEAYEGCCQLEDIEAFMLGMEFREHARKMIAERPGGGAYYDIVYKRVSAPSR